ncbi:permease [Asanoa ishikariensis]|uniref:Solute:Na+ symporter, SSS family n=1 Tax=Asanoa ishikariensis TaxID=137265 RepID=A0A1H3PBI4_9ACTN|nr:sodium:solute symporter family protein [Asanoa ishikariensis]GIF67938.1 permease [Asanoa ishikariensis]SDY98512.1 solute:Na+ symporter, SSS family [Asanoa ishikariensis]
MAVTVFLTLLGAMLLLGFAAARWRRPDDIHSLEEWGVGGRAFGNWVSWFLLGGTMYSAYTFVAVPALTYGVGAIGFFAVPFAIITTPLAFIFTARIWSVAHRHGLLTPGEFARARFGSTSLGALVALTGIIATMPYVAVQLLALKAVFSTVGVSGEWPLLIAVAMVSLSTFRSGLRAPALLSIAKDILLAWVVLSALLVVTMSSGWGEIFRKAGGYFATTPSPNDGLILNPTGQLGFVTLVLGSALSVFAYPHAVTGMLSAKDRSTVRRNIAASPIYCLVLGLMALLGFFALTEGIRPLDGDLNTVMPQMFQKLFPGWSAGIAYAALGVAALIPAAVMSISAANAFTRSIYRTYLRPAATPPEEARVSRWASLVVKFGALAVILVMQPSYAVDLQLIGGVIILQTIPAVFIGLATGWFDWRALVAGLVTGLVTSLALLWDIQQIGAGGVVVKAHFGGSSMPVGDTGMTVYVGVVALAVNLLVTTVLTLLLRLLRIPPGRDRTTPADYVADADDPMIKRLDEILDGLPARPVGAHARTAGSRSP